MWAVGVSIPFYRLLPTAKKTACFSSLDPRDEGDYYKGPKAKGQEQRAKSKESKSKKRASPFRTPIGDIRRRPLLLLRRGETPRLFLSLREKQPRSLSLTT